MGIGVSVMGQDQSHIRIYNNLLKIKTESKRLQMLDVLLAGSEYVTAAKRAGIYAGILSYYSAVRAGRGGVLLPGEQAIAPPTASPDRFPMPTINQRKAPLERPMEAHGQVALRQDGINPFKTVGKQGKAEKALTYFTSCLRVLGIEEEVALTEDSLKSSYRKASRKSHPDKGGSEEDFKAVTQAYVYLSDILKLTQGRGGNKDVDRANRVGRGVGPGGNAAIEDVSSIYKERDDAAVGFQYAEPVKLNPKNLNLKVFNKMFEDTRLPDPDEDGYGDWLKDEEMKSKAPVFSGQFNRDLFNKVFQEESSSRIPGQSAIVATTHNNPEALTLSVQHGVELGRDRPQSYTAAANAGLKYTDLKQAYTTENTFSGQVANVRVEPRNLETYRASRDKGPAPFSKDEQDAFAQMERDSKLQEQRRALRAADEYRSADDFFKKMQQLVIRDT